MEDYRHITRNILRVYRQSDDAVVDEGLDWYPSAGGTVERIGWHHGVGLTHSCVALAHLSPRMRWKENLQVLDLLLAGQQRPAWVLTRSWDFALASLYAPDPLATFGRTAYKTRNFARALLGDPHAVVVDIWAARVAGVPDRVIKTKSGYLYVAEAYHRAARRVGISARDCQAVTWCAHRGASS